MASLPSRANACAALVAISSALLLGACGSDDSSATPAPVTVTVTPEATTATESPAEPPATAEVPEPEAQDFEATAIYTVQTETTSYGGSSDELVARLLKGVCGSMLASNGKNVDDFGFELADAFLDSAGVKPAERDLVMRAATAFCPQTLEAVAEYTTAN